MLIGLSLSFCIRDISNGLVNIDEVMLIVASTNWHFPEQLGMAIQEYSKSYWKDNPKKCGEILGQLYKDRKIIQPRNFNMTYPNITQGHWAKQYR